MDLLAVLLPLAQEASDPAEEGRNIITGMLIVGVIFAGWVIIGELIHHWRFHRR